MAHVETVKGTTDIAIINRILERDGCIVITDLLDADETVLLRQQLELNFAEIPSCNGDFFGYATKRMSGVIRKSTVAQKMATLAPILGVMDHFLLQFCREYQLNLTQAIQIHPGEPAQIIHTDELLFPFDHPGKQAMLNCMWAVDDFTESNGATLLVPGSHKWAPDRKPNDDEVVKGVMPAGSVLIYFGGLLHAGGANVSQGPRTGLVLSYCLGWLRQVENHYLSIPLEVAKTYPERLQRLLGYFVHAPNMGCVEGQDPILLLKDEKIENGEFKEFMPDEIAPLLKEYRDSKHTELFNDRKKYSNG